MQIVKYFDTWPTLSAMQISFYKADSKPVYNIQYSGIIEILYTSIALDVNVLNGFIGLRLYNSLVHFFTEYETTVNLPSLLAPELSVKQRKVKIMSYSIIGGLTII
jgi:hypothetical protein